MPHKVTVQPAEEPVTLAEAKAWLKVQGSAEDDLLNSLITAARQKVEEYTNLKLVTQTIEEVYDCFPTYYEGMNYGALPLTCSPLIAVSSVEYQATAGTYTTLSTDSYTVHDYSKPATITPVYSGNWPTHILFPESVKVTYTAGFGAASAVPGILKNAILKIIAQWYEKRQENVRKMPTDVEWMLNANRIASF